jgi:uncharacterized protein with von Willebrand factor type A (vWA) domain
LGTHCGWHALSNLVPVDSDRFEAMESVASLRLKGKTETAVARELGLQRKVVIELFNEYKDIIRQDAGSRDMARDHLDMMVKHYDRLIEKSYDVYRSLELMAFDEKIAAQMNTTLKNISEYEAKRVDALQKAGLLDANDLGDELAEMEEKQQVLIDILRNDLCPACRITVARKLQGVTQTVEAVVVYDDGN